MKHIWYLAFLVTLAAVTTAGAAEKATQQKAANPNSTAEARTDSSRNSSSDLRLDDITIEGDVDIPRVLFIESRDHLRDHDYLTHLFLRSAAQVGAETPLRRILHWSPKGEQ